MSIYINSICICYKNKGKSTNILSIIKRNNKKSHYTSRIYHSSRVITLGEFFCSHEQGIEGICAIGTVFEQVFFGLCQLLSPFILVESVAPTGNVS